jgi:hypothetical protein
MGEEVKVWMLQGSLPWKITMGAHCLLHRLEFGPCFDVVKNWSINASEDLIKNVVMQGLEHIFRAAEGLGRSKYGYF